MFRSFAWAGYEAASHLRGDHARVDALRSSGHDRWARLDHAILGSLGVRTVREALRWHLIGEGTRDWSSAQVQVEAALAMGVEIVWDICHWGVPDGMDVMAPDWPRRLADFAHDAARMLRREGGAVAGWVPVNEMSFWAWAGGHMGYFAPHLIDQGDALKRQLVHGHLAVVDALRQLGRAEPLLVCEPLIWVHPASDAQADVVEAHSLVESSFDAIRWVLEADPTAIDVIGLNFYPHNQWVMHGERLLGADPRKRSLSSLLADVSRRFGLPLVVSETGAEEPDGDAWLAEMRDQLSIALAAGAPVQGVCVYPVTDYLGWDDERHCPCGPIGMREGMRFVRPGQAAAMRALNALAPKPHPTMVRDDAGTSLALRAP
ncbi:MAG: family 1 glycosylhydrolase [Rubritepida sp.]|nr:family 1 glycosylhydrolase [Rubritepida sp.]